jgi:protein phosphatase
MRRRTENPAFEHRRTERETFYTAERMVTEGTGAPLFEVEAAAEKNVGARPYDEDGVLVRPDLGLFAVADGAGGENAGNVASSLALAGLARHFEGTREAAAMAPLFDVLGLPSAARRLSSGFQQANREVLEVAKSSSRYRGMGTTMVAIVPDPANALVHLAHVGDSRAYRMRQGRLELLTQDHSLANEVLELRPDLPEAEAARLPRNVITRALGMSEALRVSVRTLDLAPQDRFVMCSDGLTDVLSDDEIADTLANLSRSDETAKGLIARALAAPADDNVAVLVVRIDAARGITSVPKRHLTRPPPSVRRPSDSPSDDAEIVMIDDGDDSSDPEIVIVPANAARSDMKAAVRDSVPRPRPRSVLDAVTMVDDDGGEDA